MTKACTLEQVADDELDRIRLDCRPTGLPSGIGLERRVPGGISRDKVMTLFAESGSFKTTVVGNIMLAMGAAGHKSLFVSLEDSKSLAGHRLLARDSGVAYGEIAGGVLDAGQIAQLALAADTRRASGNVWIIDDSQVEPNIDAILQQAADAKARVGIACLTIDYLQLLEGRGDERSVLKEAVVKSRRFASQHGVAVVLISQQNDNNHERPNPRPQLRDMFGSSAMRMGSKLIVGMFRPYRYWPEPSNARDRMSGMYARFLSANPDHAALYPGILELHVIKNVLGDERPIHVLVNPATGVLQSADNMMAPYL